MKQVNKITVSSNKISKGGEEMRKNKNILAILMSLFMVLSMLPVSVFAAETVTLDGKLKIHGTAMTESTLSAEFKEVKPEGLTEDSVNYVWSRLTPENEAAEKAGETPELKELGKEKTYKITADDVGSKIVLTVIGIEDKGFTGTLKATTDTVAEKTEVTPSETPAADAAEEIASGENTEAALPEDTAQTSDSTAEDQNQDVQENTEAQTDETQQEIPEAAPAEDTDTESGMTDQSQEVSETEVADQQETSENTDTGIPEATSDDNTDETAGTTAVDGIPAATEDGTYGNSAEESGQEDAAADETKQSDAGSEEAAVYYQASAVVGDGTAEVMDFGTVTEGQETSVEGQFVTVTNTGTGTLNFTGITPENFAVQDITSPLEPGQSVQLWVSPREGRSPGSYEDIITYTSEEGAEASFTAKVTVEAAQNSDSQDSDGQDNNAELPEGTPETQPGTPEETPEEPAGTDENTVILQASAESVDFTDKAPKTVTIKNSSETALTVNAAALNGNVTVTPASQMINPGESFDFTVTPTEVLDIETTYEDSISFTADEDETKTVAVKASIKIAAPVLTVDNPKLEFGKAVVGYAEAPKEQYVTITNTGSKDATNVTVTNSVTNFEFTLKDTVIPAGQSTTLTVRPVKNLSAKGDEYTDSFEISDAEGTNAVVTAYFTVEDASHLLNVYPESLNFASAKKGYGQISGQEFTVTNSGNMAETLIQPAANNFQISAVSADALNLNPGESVSFTVTPKTGLNPGDYSETVKIVCSTSNAEGSLKVDFQVVKGTASITKIQQPSEIKNLANGTKKEANALKLPSTVVIETTNGNMKASVTWDMKKCSYDASSTKAQSFTVTGAVTLPEGVDNDNKIALTTTVKVSVNAYSAKLASADNNKITGIEYNGVYTTQSKISFTAIGAGMDNGSPKEEDTRYVPLNWTVINTNGWNAAPYTASFGLAQSGSYTLKVTFKQQKYSGSMWSDTGSYDTKQVPFSVTKAKVTAPGLDITPAANQKKPVKTGDNTPIAPLVIILIIAAGAACGVIVYKKKRK